MRHRQHYTSVIFSEEVGFEFGSEHLQSGRVLNVQRELVPLVRSKLGEGTVAPGYQVCAWGLQGHLVIRPEPGSGLGVGGLVQKVGYVGWSQPIEGFEDEREDLEFHSTLHFEPME